MKKKYKIELQANTGLEAVMFGGYFVVTLDDYGNSLVVPIGTAGKFQVLRPETEIKVYIKEFHDEVPKEN